MRACVKDTCLCLSLLPNLKKYSHVGSGWGNPMGTLASSPWYPRSTPPEWRLLLESLKDLQKLELQSIPQPGLEQ